MESPFKSKVLKPTEPLSSHHKTTMFCFTSLHSLAESGSWNQDLFHWWFKSMFIGKCGCSFGSHTVVWV